MYLREIGCDGEGNLLTVRFISALENTVRDLLVSCNLRAEEM
jgi:hypothetical protein